MQFRERASSVAIAAAGFSALFGLYAAFGIGISEDAGIADLQFQSFWTSLAAAAAGISVLAQRLSTSGSKAESVVEAVNHARTCPVRRHLPYLQKPLKNRYKARSIERLCFNYEIAGLTCQRTLRI